MFGDGTEAVILGVAFDVAQQQRRLQIQQREHRRSTLIEQLSRHGSELAEGTTMGCVCSRPGAPVHARVCAHVYADVTVFRVKCAHTFSHIFTHARARARADPPHLQSTTNNNATRLVLRQLTMSSRIVNRPCLISEF